VIEQNKIAGLQSALELANHKNEDLQNKINSLLAGGKEFEKTIADLKSKYSDYNSLKSDSDRMKSLLIQKDGDMVAVMKQRDAAESRLKSENGQREEAIASLSNDLQTKDIELTKLRKELNIAKTQLKLLETKTEDVKKPTGPGSKVRCW
jgi:flagellar biosynthesis chaperone FliJ